MTSSPKALNRPEQFCVVFGVNIFVVPDIDYFVFTLWLLHGKSERSHQKRKLTYSETFMGYKPLKLGNLRGTDWILTDKSVLAPVQQIQSVPSILSSDSERYEMAS